MKKDPLPAASPSTPAESQSARDIEQALPHRAPMLLIDRVVEQDEDGQWIVCEKEFHENEFFFRGHYPGFPLVPGVILCESAMQAGAVLLSRHTQGASGIPVATRLSDVKFKRIVRPGETVRLEVRLKERLADAFFLAARVTCDGKLAARLDFACALTPRPGGE